MKWFVARTGPMMEFAAVTRFKRAGAVAFVPIEVKWTKRPGKALRTKRNYPIFVRYAFVGSEDIRQLWGMLREDPDVYPRVMQGVLGINRTLPFELAPEEVSYLASLSENPVPYVQSVNPHKAALAVKEGQQAQVTEGPFAGRSGKVLRVVGKKAHVLTEMFNSLLEIEISVAALEATG